ncbi:hypothetical protein AB0B10_26075 [Micromonospora arborensis]|uniref:hypothetical protein n=1 Tax=Micromonospora arborensis TaxID=2116518 RepID=UPI0033CBFFFA
MKAWEREIAIRATRTREEAIARNSRGYALAQAALNAALTGGPQPELPQPSQPGQAQPARPARLESVACGGCYRPIIAPPGSLCDSCQSAPSQEVSNA